MTNVTNCPSCQTQFVVTDEQLSQYNGKVRCGNCLHVFDATKELVDVNEATNETSEADYTVLSDDEEIVITYPDTVETPEFKDEVSHIVDNAFINDAQLNEHQASYFEKLNNDKKINSPLYKWLLGVAALILLIAAILQGLYYWRNDIAMYYPTFKPFLTQVCEKLGCSIEFPKKIEFIIIDDSDMQEDADHEGVIHFTSTLINQAGFIQSYPNIELTLTDVEDKPKLRRIFKPAEYLPQHTDVALGLPAGAEIKVKLALTAQNEPVAGYRIAVNY